MLTTSNEEGQDVKDMLTTSNGEKKAMSITERLLQAMEKKEKMPMTLCLSQSMK